MLVEWNGVALGACQAVLDFAYLGHVGVHQAKIEEHESCIGKGSGRHCYCFFLLLFLDGRCVGT